MSSIAIRFDGLVPLLALALGAIGYLVIATSAAILAMRRTDGAPSDWRLTTRAMLMALATLAVFVVLLFWWSGTGTSGRYPWLDHLLWPWLAVFCAGCWTLTRDPDR